MCKYVVFPHLNHWYVEELDDDVLEDRLVHFQRIKILRPRNFPVKSHKLFGADLATGFQVPVSSPDHLFPTSKFQTKTSVELKLLASLDKPGTTTGTWLSDLQFSEMFIKIWWLPSLPFMGVPMVFAEFSKG